jgi:hypothetical protein
LIFLNYVFWFSSNEPLLRSKALVNDFSQQILPVNQLIVNNTTARDRSRSENDLAENSVDTQVCFFVCCSF